MTEPPVSESYAPEAPAVPAVQGSNEQAIGRDLFRYLVTSEWADYRAIMGVFADTFFSEFTPEDVAARLADAGLALETAIVGERLDSLRRWGNLTVSSAVGNPKSIQDYYRRRNRYLITRPGQEVHQLVEGVLTRVDAVTDVSTARLRALIDALDRLAALDAHREDPNVLADAAGAGTRLSPPKLPSSSPPSTNGRAATTCRPRSCVFSPRCSSAMSVNGSRRSSAQRVRSVTCSRRCASSSRRSPNA
jgi:hypothetical protein